MRITPDSPTFQRMWNAAVTDHADRTFLVFRSPDAPTAQAPTTQWTYAQFDRLVAGAAAKMAEHGVTRGSSVHVALANSPAFVMAWLAAARLGAWLVPVDPASSARDIANQIRRTTPTLGICAAARQDAYLEGAAGQLDAIITVTETAADTVDGSTLLSLGDAGNGAGNPAEPADRLAVMFTSGTTSEPKGVVLTQRNYHHLSQTMSRLVDLRPEHRWFVTLPMFHGNAQFYCFGPAIAVGASVAMTSAFSASGWVRQAAELAVTHASLFAAPIRMILARTPSGAPQLSLRHVWFAQSLGDQHYRDFAGLVGTAPRQLYGMTETTAVVTADLSENPRNDVIGTPAGGRVIALLDPLTELPVGPDEPGMLVVRGRRGVDLFQEYMDAPAINDRAFFTRDGGTWFRTGDLARADANGDLHFVGRIDDVIKVAGENVSLTEVEAALAQAPGVLEVAVLARPDPIRDQVPVAFIVPRDAANPPSVDDLAAWAAQNLAPQSRPREWTLLDELPRTSVGKIRRFKLQQDPAGAASTMAPA